MSSQEEDTPSWEVREGSWGVGWSLDWTLKDMDMQTCNERHVGRWKHLEQRHGGRKGVLLRTESSESQG